MIKLIRMKLTKISEEVFQTLEASEMKKVAGGYSNGTSGSDPCTMTKNSSDGGVHDDGVDPYTD